MTTKTTNLTTTDGLTVYDLDVHGSELTAVAGPAGYDPATIDTDELPEGFRWVDVDEWEELTGEFDDREPEPPRPTVEYCTNDERIAADLCDEYDIDHIHKGEVARLYLDEAIRYAEENCNVELVSARGQRMLLHGWNGAHFTTRCGIFGSFDDMDEATEQALNEADEKGRQVARKWLERYAG